MLSDEWLVRYTPLELLERKTLSNSTNGTEVEKNKQTYERKYENNICLGINAGATKKWHKCRGYKKIYLNQSHCRKMDKMVEICNITKPLLYLICAVYLFYRYFLF